MTEQTTTPPIPEPNPITRHAHRQQSFWQIKLPFFICAGLLVVAAAMVLFVGIGRGGALNRFADVSVMWLIAPLLILGLILVILQIALIYVLVRLLPAVPRATRQVQDFFMLLSIRMRRVADMSAEPFLRVHSLSASMGALRRSLRRPLRQSEQRKQSDGS
jgi:hypothetical protein